MDYPTIQPFGVGPPQAPYVPNQAITGNMGGTNTTWGDSTGVTISGTQGIWAGATTQAAAKFSVDLLGNLVAHSATVDGYIIVGGAASDVNSGVVTISGGKLTANTVTADRLVTGTITAASGVIHDISASTITTGTLNASLITVTNLTANSITTGTLNGSIVGVQNLNGSSSSTFVSNLLDGSVVNLANLNAGHITAGTLTVGGVSAAAGITINQTGIKGSAVLKFQGGSSMWEDSSGNLGLWSFNGTGGSAGMYFYVTGDANAHLILTPGTNQNSMYSGLYIHQMTAGTAANFNVEGDAHIVKANAVGGNLVVDGNSTVTGTKSFDILHPTKEGMRLRYNCLEAPEVLVFCRGICNTEEDIVYPQDFIDISIAGTIQCQVGKLRGSEKISWFATGTRKGYGNFESEYTGIVPGDYPIEYHYLPDYLAKNSAEEHTTIDR